uniref:hypothetical protein n=1 Tax=Paractinoplanes polyasparticus TaxID=2856853 RepID=UPI001C85DC36|nr:hypothetical protein [Actinoplanes polyasparticus]
MTHHKTLAFVMATVATLLLSACGDKTEPRAAAGNEAQVATLQSSAAVAPSPSSDGRPIIRPDATREDIDRLDQAYFKCLDDHGVPQDKDEDGNFVKGDALETTSKAKVDAGRAACADKDPESWLDVERRTNPEFPDTMRIAANCMKDKGYNARVVKDPQWRIAYGTTAEFMRADEDETNCIEDAFAERIKTYQ